GGILVAGVVRDQVRDKLSFSFDDLGDRNVKNIPRPVRAYRVKLNDDGPPPSAKPADRVGSGGRRIAGIVAAALLLIVVVVGAAWYFARGSQSAATVAQPGVASLPLAGPAKPLPHLSIVVLPFANLSGDGTQDYFADGVTESLTTDLSRISGSFVIARNTAFTFKGKNVDAESGGHLWAERFDKPLSNLFGLQDDIVASLASQLGAELITNEARRAERTPNPDSIDLYFQGMARFNKGRSVENVAQARNFFERALALDPGNLDALLGTAAADASAALGYFVDNKAERLVTIEANLNRVLSQSPNNARAHDLMCRVQVNSKRGAQGIAECERALALNPNLAAARAQIGLAKVIDGHPEETEGHVLEALRVSPHDTEAVNWVAYMAFAKLHLGAYEEAVGLYRRAEEL